MTSPANPVDPIERVWSAHERRGRWGGRLRRAGAPLAFLLALGWALRSGGVPDPDAGPVLARYTPGIALRQPLTEATTARYGLWPTARLGFANVSVPLRDGLTLTQVVGVPYDLHDAQHTMVALPTRVTMHAGDAATARRVEADLRKQFGKPEVHCFTSGRRALTWPRYLTRFETRSSAPGAQLTVGALLALPEDARRVCW